MTMTRGMLCVILFVMASLGLLQAQVVPTQFKPFNNFVEGTKAADPSFYTSRVESRVMDTASFEEMRRYVLATYEGIHVGHSFVRDNNHFDCVPIMEQPSVRALGLKEIASPPPAGHDFSNDSGQDSFGGERSVTVTSQFDPKQAFDEFHILNFENEARILAVAAPHIRALVVLILETGLRSHREALALKWGDIDFSDDVIRIQESKTSAGIRSIPISSRCKSELLRWRDRVGPEYSRYVFPNMRTPTKPMKNVRHAWAKALTDAGLEYFWLYNLRHTFSSRLSAAGVPDLFVAQMIGHSSPSILRIYSRVDEFRRDAVRKLELLRAENSALAEIVANVPIN